MTFSRCSLLYSCVPVVERAAICGSAKEEVSLGSSTGAGGGGSFLGRLTSITATRMNSATTKPTRSHTPHMAYSSSGETDTDSFIAVILDRACPLSAPGRIFTPFQIDLRSGRTSIEFCRSLAPAVTANQMHCGVSCALGNLRRSRYKALNPLSTCRSCHWRRSLRNPWRSGCASDTSRSAPQRSRAATAQPPHRP